ncbi:MAG: hypothetical protein ACJ73E_13615 [Mycobacteriales bacterium]
MVPPAAGAEAELARLRRPTGPWLHLLDAAPADARQLGWVLSRDGVVVRILRGHCGRSTYGLLDEVGAALQLPGDPAEDWSALGTLLTDMGWLPAAGHVLVVTRASLLLAAEPVRELRRLVGAVHDVARGRAEEGDPVPFHLVLQDDTVGIATLRRRLDAVGAKHADLAGWDAEEPVAEVTAGTRSVLRPGPPGADEVDLAAGTAVSPVDGVRSLGRVWEEFRGGTGAVRVYVPVLTDTRWAAPVAALIAGAAAEAGASCVVVPVPVEVAARDSRQVAVGSAATVVWPVPELPPAPGQGADATAAADPATLRDAANAEGTARAAGFEGPARSTGSGDAAGGAGGGAAGAAGDEAACSERPGAGDRHFELVAANLQWDFDPGDPDPDAVDAAVVAHVSTAGRTTRLFRTWVKEPDDGWVRVIVAYVGPRGSIAEVEAERTAVVDALQRAGEVRCCVEVLAASDVGDVHRWLEERCRSLWPTGPQSRPQTGPLPADTDFAPGPGPEDLEDLVRWATDSTGVTALVTAWADLAGSRTLIVGVVVDGSTDPDRVRVEAARHAPAARIEPLAPSRRLEPAQLRLTRSGTRLWYRRTGAAPEQPGSRGGLARVDPPKVVALGPLPVRDTDEPRGDVQLDGFTLVGIDRRTEIAKGNPQPDEQDTRIVQWAQVEPAAIAVLRAVATVGEGTIPVYCACVKPEADPEAVRRQLAAAVAATGATRAAAEAFAPAGEISAFHLDLAVGSTRLWPVRA